MISLSACLRRCALVRGVFWTRRTASAAARCFSEHKLPPISQRDRFDPRYNVLVATALARVHDLIERCPDAESILVMMERSAEAFNYPLAILSFQRLRAFAEEQPELYSSIASDSRLVHLLTFKRRIEGADLEQLYTLLHEASYWTSDSRYISPIFDAMGASLNAQLPESLSWLAVPILQSLINFNLQRQHLVLFKGVSKFLVNHPGFPFYLSHADLVFLVQSVPAHVLRDRCLPHLALSAFNLTASELGQVLASYAQFEVSSPSPLFPSLTPSSRASDLQLLCNEAFNRLEELSEDGQALAQAVQGVHGQNQLSSEWIEALSPLIPKCVPSMQFGAAATLARCLVPSDGPSSLSPAQLNALSLLLGRLESSLQNNPALSFERPYHSLHTALPMIREPQLSDAVQRLMKHKPSTQDQPRK